MSDLVAGLLLGGYGTLAVLAARVVLAARRARRRPDRSIYGR